MDLITLWFGLVVFLWAGFFVLEGFDFGVGILARLRGRDEADRGRMLDTIGPHWDGNEVWLVCAVGAIFAAFPGWYADLLSANYLLLVLVLVALIVRGVALEYRGKRPEQKWRRRCDNGILVGSVFAPFGLGVLITGSVPGGVLLLGLCVAQGYAFLRLKLPPAPGVRTRGAGSWLLFGGTTVAIVLSVVIAFGTGYSVAELVPLASGEYGLRVISWMALIIMPVVLGYQFLGYRVLHRRLAAR